MIELSEKAKSRAQQRLMGAVLNAKRTGEASTPEVAKLALTMKTSDVKDFASTKHKNLPEKKKKKEEVNEGSEHTQWSASIMLPSKRRKFVVVSCPSRDRKDAIQIIKALYGTDDIKQLNRIGLRVENIMRKIVRKYAKKKEEKKPQKDMSAGGRARRVLQRREYRDKVSSIIPKELEDQKNWKEFKKFLG